MKLFRIPGKSGWLVGMVTLPLLNQKKTMTEFLQSLFITSLFIFGLTASFSEGYIFHPIDKWIEQKLPKWLYYPLIACSICMSSFWGTLAYFICFYDGILLWIPFCFCLCGLNFLILRLYESIQNIGQ